MKCRGMWMSSERKAHNHGPEFSHKDLTDSEVHGSSGLLTRLLLTGITYTRPTIGPQKTTLT